MHSDWQTFLITRHAIIANGRVTRFENSNNTPHTIRTSNFLADLSHFGLIRFSGDDAQSFLQSQLTCDIRDITTQHAQYGSYCNSSGRILTSFLLWQQEQDYLMRLPASLCAATQKRLSLYVLRAKVKLFDHSNSLVQLGISGPDAISMVTKLITPASHFEQLQVFNQNDITILHLSAQRSILIVPVDQAPAIWDQFSQYVQPVSADYWDWLDIQSGIPMILPETQEKFIPQMVNLDAIGAVSFKKGCYPGQEIVARTQYLGKIKKRMYLAHIDTKLAVSAGDSLFSANMDDQSCGNIVNATVSPLGGYDVLAVIQCTSADSQTIHWESLQGPQLILKALPYSLPIQGS